MSEVLELLFKLRTEGIDALDKIAGSTKAITLETKYSSSELQKFQTILQADIATSGSYRKSLEDIAKSSKTLGAETAGIAAELLKTDKQLQKTADEAEKSSKRQQAAIQALGKAQDAAIKENAKRDEERNATDPTLAGLRKGALSGAFGIGAIGGIGFQVGRQAAQALKDALVALTTEYTSAAHETVNFGQRMDITAGQARTLENEARIAGVSIHTLESSARITATALEDSDGAGKKAAAAFARLGVDTRDAFGGIREAGPVTLDLIEKLSQIESQTERTREGSAALGRGYKEIIPLVDQYRELQKASEELGVNLQSNVIEQAAKADEEFNKLGLAFDVLKNKLAQKILPIVVSVTESVTRVIAGKPEGGVEAAISEFAIIGLGQISWPFRAAAEGYDAIASPTREAFNLASGTADANNPAELLAGSKNDLAAGAAFQLDAARKATNRRKNAALEDSLEGSDLAGRARKAKSEYEHSLATLHSEGENATDKDRSNVTAAKQRSDALQEQLKEQKDANHTAKEQLAELKRISVEARSLSGAGETPQQRLQSRYEADLGNPGFKILTAPQQREARGALISNFLLGQDTLKREADKKAADKKSKRLQELDQVGDESFSVSGRLARDAARETAVSDKDEEKYGALGGITTPIGRVTKVELPTIPLQASSQDLIKQTTDDEKRQEKLLEVKARPGEELATEKKISDLRVDAATKVLALELNIARLKGNQAQQDQAADDAREKAAQTVKDIHEEDALKQAEAQKQQASEARGIASSLTEAAFGGSRSVRGFFAGEGRKIASQVSGNIAGPLIESGLKGVTSNIPTDGTFGRLIGRGLAGTIIDPNKGKGVDANTAALSRAASASERTATASEQLTPAIYDLRAAMEAAASLARTPAPNATPSPNITGALPGLAPLAATPSEALPSSAATQPLGPLTNALPPDAAKAIGKIVPLLSGNTAENPFTFRNSGPTATGAPPSTTDASGRTVVDNLLNLLPKYGDGGTVTQPTLAWIGERGETEHVVPESKLSAFIADKAPGLDLHAPAPYQSAANPLTNPHQPLTGTMGDLINCVPHFAQGATVTSPTLALIGDGGEPEHVIPDSMLHDSGASMSLGDMSIDPLPKWARKAAAAVSNDAARNPGLGDFSINLPESKAGLAFQLAAGASMLPIPYGKLAAAVPSAVRSAGEAISAGEFGSERGSVSLKPTAEPWQVPKANLVPYADTVPKAAASAIEPSDYSEAGLHEATIRNRNNQTVPPEPLKQHPVGSWGTDSTGELMQLRTIRFDDSNVIFPEGSPYPGNHTVEKYSEWIKAGSPSPPMRAVETEAGNIKIQDGHHRASAIKETGGETADVWVSITRNRPIGGGQVMPEGLTHENAVKQAVASGKPVPAKVLAGYPTLKEALPSLAQSANIGSVAPAVSGNISAVDLIPADIQQASARLQERFSDLLKSESGEESWGDLSAEHLKDLATVGGYYLRKTGRQFNEFSASMVDRFGEQVRPYLDQTFAQARHIIPGFDPKMEQVIAQKMPAKASAAQVSAIVTNAQNGIKADELKWAPVTDWLKTQTEPVTKQSVLQFTREHALKLEEVEKGKRLDYDRIAKADAALKQTREEFAAVQTGRTQIKEGDRVSTVGSAPSRGGYSYSTGKVYEATKDQVGIMHWKHVEDFGDTRSWRSDKFVRDLKADAQYPWLDSVKHNDIVGQTSAQTFTGDNLSLSIANAKVLQAEREAEAARRPNGTPPKFESWKSKGGEDYRELLITQPSKASTRLSEIDSELSKVRADQYQLSISDWWRSASQGERSRALGKMQIAANVLRAEQTTLTAEASSGIYKSQHWDEKNVLTHIRFDTRTASDGAKTLHVEEIQSDWHQQGREKGYAPTQEQRAKIAEALTAAEEEHTRTADARSATLERTKTAFFGPERTSAFEAHDAAEEANTRAYGVVQGLRSQLTAGVSNAPFSKDWHELAFRRAVNYAAENGFDRMSWSTGKQQAARYDLSKQVDSIHYSPEEQRLWAVKDGKNVIDQPGITRDQIPDYVGKDLAKKLIVSPVDEGSFDRQSLTGKGLQVGGEGMSGFYDQILPNYAAKYLKKYGVTVGETKLPGIAGKVHSVDITPAMREDLTAPITNAQKRLDQRFNPEPPADLTPASEADIPKYATGAIFTQPTIAQVGEAGTEYLIPQSLMDRAQPLPNSLTSSGTVDATSKALLASADSLATASSGLTSALGVTPSESNTVSPAAKVTIANTSATQDLTAATNALTSALGGKPTSGSSAPPATNSIFGSGFGALASGAIGSILPSIIPKNVASAISSLTKAGTLLSGAVKTASTPASASGATGAGASTGTGSGEAGTEGSDGSLGSPDNSSGETTAWASASPGIGPILTSVIPKTATSAIGMTAKAGSLFIGQASANIPAAVYNGGEATPGDEDFFNGSGSESQNASGSESGDVSENGETASQNASTDTGSGEAGTESHNDTIGDSNNSSGETSGSASSVSKYGAAGAAIATGAIAAFDGFSKGGAKGATEGVAGTLDAAAGIAALIPGGQLIAAGLAVAGAITGVVGSLLGDPKAQRAKTIANDLGQNQYFAPTAWNVTESGNGNYEDIDARGNLRTSNLSAVPTVAEPYGTTAVIGGQRNYYSVPGHVDQPYSGDATGSGQTPVANTAVPVPSAPQTHNYYIQALDPASFGDFLQRPAANAALGKGVTTHLQNSGEQLAAAIRYHVGN